MGRPWHVHTVCGRAVRVHDDLCTALAVRDMLGDDVLDGREKGALAIRMLAVDPDAFAEAFRGRLQEALDEVLGSVFGIREGPAPRGRPFDWDHDRARIVATARGAYGLSWEGLRDLPYTEACTLMALSPEDSPLGQAIHYRLAERPRPTRHNREQLEAFDRLRRFYALPEGGASDSVEAKNAAATAAFARLAGRG